MRKVKILSNWILLLVYLPAVVGLGFNVHYCGQTVESVHVFASGNSGCGCPDDEPPGCCKDEWSYFKLSDNSQEISSARAFVTFVTELPAILHDFSYPFATVSEQYRLFAVWRDPPDVIRFNRCILYRSLLI